MNFQVRPNLTTAGRQLPFECVALVLQGGGALGAYQGGVYEALAEAKSIQTGSPAYRLEPSTLPSSRETRPTAGSIGCASFGPGDFERALALAQS